MEHSACPTDLTSSFVGSLEGSIVEAPLDQPSQRGGKATCLPSSSCNTRRLFCRLNLQAISMSLVSMLTAYSGAVGTLPVVTGCDVRGQGHDCHVETVVEGTKSEAQFPR